MIAITIPTNRGFKAKTVLSLLEMISYSKQDFKFVIPTDGYNTAENRNYSVAQAIKAGCSHILFSDDDMVYPPDTLERLLAHDKDIIGTLYSVRRTPKAYVIEYLEEGIKNDEEARTEPFTFKCKAIGTGMLLVKTDVFKKLQSPFFGYKWYDNGMVSMSTDWFFLEKAREAGFDVWCDPTLKLGHLGEYEY